MQEKGNVTIVTVAESFFFFLNRDAVWEFAKFPSYLHNKFLVNVFLRYVGLKVGRF